MLELISKRNNDIFSHIYAETFALLLLPIVVQVEDLREEDEAKDGP